MMSGSHKNTQKSNLVARGVTNQLEMYTEVMLDRFLCEQETKLPLAI